jgi:hypothetical protein
LSTFLLLSFLFLVVSFILLFLLVFFIDTAFLRLR